MAQKAPQGIKVKEATREDILQTKIELLEKLNKDLLLERTELWKQVDELKQYAPKEHKTKR